ncbi:MAG: ABC transporter permease, partial [Methylobacter sp.]|nr:ABC transporter permease [Methylobacter sp.]
MTDTSTTQDLPPLLEVLKQDSGQRCVKLSGNWNLRGLMAAPELSRKISQYAVGDIQWDMQSVDLLDSASALILWQAWGGKMPVALQIRPEHQHLFDQWQAQELPPPESVIPRSSLFVKYVE